jgi:hypothetical protein
VFAVLWALAAIFHVVGPSGRTSDVLHGLTAVGVSQVVVCLAAVAVLLVPRAVAPLAALAVSTLVCAWLEAPVLGNHWLVAAFVDLGLLGGILASRSGRRIDRERLAAVALPVARWTLIGFYCFAAFSKLNHAFFDTSVGCGTFYFDELASSLGLGTPIAVGQGGWAHGVPFVVAGTELSIPLLLLFRRTRNVGVVVGLLFHSVIALDTVHLFSDFSSVLAPLFCIFLPAAWASGVIRRWQSLPARAAMVVQGVTIGALAAVLVSHWMGEHQQLFLDGRMWLWYATDAVVLALVLDHVLRHRRTVLESPLALAAVPRWLWVVPVLVVFNGLTPYLEIKTAYSWNMYANLVTADGRTNHLLVPRTLAINPSASDLVSILGTDDPALGVYRDLGYELPYLSLRAYLSKHRSASLRYRMGSVERTLAHASDDPDLVRPVGELERRLFALRSVDEQDPPRCQETFLPAL